MNEPDCDVEATTLPAGQCRDRPLRQIPEVECRQQFVRANTRSVRGQSVALALREQFVPNSLVVPTSVALPDVPQAASDGVALLSDAMPGDAGRSRRRRQQGREHA